MPYIINRYNGNQLLILDDGVLESTSIPLGLVGRNYTGWGEVFNENFVFLLENFYNASPPARPLSGQIWYDSSGNVLKSYNGVEWLAIGNSNVSSTEPTHSQGGLWLKSTTNQLFVSDGSVWRLVGPEAVEGYGVTKISSLKLLGTDGNYYPVIKKEIDDVVVEIWSDDDFTIAVSESISGFNRLYPGSNLPGAVEVVNLPTGNLKIVFPSISRLNNKTLYPFNSSENYIEYRGENETLEIVLVKEFANGFWELRDLLATDPQPSVYYSKFGIESPNDIQDWYRISLDLAAPDTITNPEIIGPIITGESLEREILNSRYQFRGNLKGNADTATAFSVPRTINGIVFDGTTDISVKSRTPRLLIKGDYILGEDWDGGIDQIWSINASPQNRIGTVVARDANGSFSAESISSDLIGNVEGNVTALGGLSTFNEINAAIIRAELIGNSSSATKLETARTINTVPFDGTQNIILPVPANTLTTDTLASNVINSSLINVGKLESLEIEAPGLRVGDGNDLRIFIEGFTPTIRSDVNNVIKFQLLSGSGNTNQTDLTFISAASAASFGINGPALVPDLGRDPEDSKKIHLGLPANRFRNVYSQVFTGQRADISRMNGPSNTVIFEGNISVDGAVLGNLVGDVIGNVTGTVTGNLIGSSSLNMLKSGDTMSGDLSWTASDRGLSWSFDSDGASIKFYSSGEGDPNSRLEFNTFNNATEYFLWTHTLESGSKFDLMKLLPNDNFGNVKLSVFGLIESTNTITAPNFSGSGSSLTALNASNISTGNLPRGRLSGTYDISITGNSNTVTTITSGQIVTALGYTPISNSGGNFLTDISIGSTTKSTDTVVSVLAGDARKAGFEAYGNSQGTGYLYVGQSTAYGGGISYNGDGSPSFVSGETADKITFFRRDNGSSIEVFSYPYNSNTVEFNGAITAQSFSGTGSSLTSLNASNLASGTVPNARLSGTYNISVTGSSASSTTSTTATNLLGGTVSATTGSFSGALTLAAGSANGLRFPNDAFGGSGDTASITLQTSGGEATKMTFRMTNDADDGFAFIAPNINGITFNGYTMLHTGNLPDYRPSLDGQGAFGTWGINITGNAATVSTITSTQITNALGFTPVSPVSLSGAASSAVQKTGDSMSGYLTLVGSPVSSNHAATKAYVDAAVSATNIIWAGLTTLGNVISTYRNFANGTKVAFWEERSYSSPANSNGGSVAITDRYRRVVQKNSSNSWSDIGG